MQRECEHTGPASPGPLHTCFSCPRGVEVNWEGSWSGFIQGSRAAVRALGVCYGLGACSLGGPGAASVCLLLTCPWAWHYGGSAGQQLLQCGCGREPGGNEALRMNWDAPHPHPHPKENSICRTSSMCLASQVQLRAGKGSALCLGAACLLVPGNQRSCTCGSHLLAVREATDQRAAYMCSQAVFRTQK